jgi:FkbM family methyltransferase
MTREQDTQSLVYDVGVNNGDDSAYYLARGFRVVGIEANPELVAPLTERFANEIATGRLRLLNVAISEHEGTIPFFLTDGNRAVWSSLDQRGASRANLPTRRVDVPCRPFGALLREYGVPFYLKVDVEGADYLCLLALTPELAPAYVSFEASEGDLSHLCYLHAAGYRRFRLVDQLDGFALRRAPARGSTEALVDAARAVARRWRRRKPADRWGPSTMTSAVMTYNAPPATDAPSAFPISSSGPMPHVVPGDWLSFAELAAAWLHFVNREGLSNWFDVHAAR